MTVKNLDHIHRSSDGRFVVTNDSGIDIRPASIASSNSSESDDGGFLPRRGNAMRTSWRRPLVTYPSELSYLPSAASNTHGTNSRYFNGLLQIDNGAPQNLLRTVPVEFHSQPVEYDGDRPTYENLLVRNNIRHSAILSPHTPSRVSRIVASSPATSSPMGNSTIWSPQAMYFSDLSSVQQPSSAERSFPTPQSNISQLRYLQERYSQELPSLRAIHEETRRMAHGFVPLQVQLHSPSIRYPYYAPHPPQLSANQISELSPQSYHHHHHHHNQIQPMVHQRQRTRLLPRHVRMARSAPELGSPLSHLNMRINAIEASPESRSSSSGFGSKNTSAQHNQSSRSGSTNEWKYLPPYRPPPPPPQHYPQYYYASQSVPSATGTPQITPPYTMEHWLELINRLNAASEHVNVPKAVDVGSVDGHYEFDPATPTPTASTPTGTRDDQYIDTHLSMPVAGTTNLLHTQSLQPYQRKRVSKYDNIEARVQAMKEEFYEYKKRQAGVELESAC